MKGRSGQFIATSGIGCQVVVGTLPPSPLGTEPFFHGFRIGTVEDAVCWKYGKHSWELAKQTSGKNKSPN